MNMNDYVIISIPFLTTLIAFVKLYAMIKKFDLGEKVETNTKDILTLKTDTKTISDKVIKLETLMQVNKDEHREIKELVQRIDTKLDNYFSRN